MCPGMDMKDDNIGYSETPSSTSNYKLLLDEDRFEEQYLGGQRGYYDKIEKVFVSINAFDTLFAEIIPSSSSDNESGREIKAVQQIILGSRRRVEANLRALHRRTNKDSYSQMFMAYLSRRFLLQNTNKGEDHMVILYVDLVGSTALSAIVSTEELSVLIRIFCQEMSIVISKHNGYVLKYAGDAVIGYFPRNPDIISACEEAIKCALLMKQVINESINEEFPLHGFPKVKIRIALDEGKNQVVVLGRDPDLLGHVISRAAKFMNKAKPNQIVVGDNVFTNLKNHGNRFLFNSQEEFTLAGTGEIYPVHLSSDL
jgi:class 3 adenylate cyclase